MAKPRKIAKVVTAHRQREGGGFIVRRPLGGQQFSSCDPFLMLDHLGPIVYEPGEAVGAPDHPHRGFETVTYVISGGFHHKDSVGNEGNLGPGWVQWMTAGAGVIHSEMPSQELLEKGGESEGFQLWVNLPAKNKMCQPRYQDIPAEKIPEAETKDKRVSVRVVAGNSLGVRAVIETYTPIMFLDIRLKAGGVLLQEVPADFNGFIYVYRGTLLAGPDDQLTQLKEGQLGAIGAGDVLSIRSAAQEGQQGRSESSEGSGEEWTGRALLIAGVPLNEPIARYGPFVLSTQKELAQAFEDYRAGRLAKPIEGSEERMRLTEQARRKQKQAGHWDNDL